jgi:Ca-activated chloride channel homolog
MMSFDLPWAFVLLPLPLLVWWLMPPHREQTPAIRIPFFRRVTSAAGTKPYQGAVVLTRTRLQMAAAILCWCLAVLALARPEQIGEPVEITKAARDVVLAIDISGSMDQRDFVTPDGERQQRLAGVRGVVRDFVTERDGDRMALLVFGSKAYVQAPLTEDLNTITALLDRTEVGMAGPHTALGDAIGLSIRTFEASEIEQRLLILLSDGSDTASRMSPVNAAEIARGEGVQIYTVAVGDPNAQGEARVDLTTLSEIATRTGGESFFADDQAALSRVYDQIAELAPRKTETLSYRPKRSLSWIPLLALLLVGLGTTAILHFFAHRKAAA